MSESSSQGIMLQLGSFQFTVDTAAYQTLQRDDEYRWAQMDRVGQRPKPQWIGVGETRITLAGVIYPGFTRAYAVGDLWIEAMRTLAVQGKPLVLTDGRGNVYGQWVITAISETASTFLQDGTPRKQEFNITLLYYDLLTTGQTTDAQTTDAQLTDMYWGNDATGVYDDGVANPVTNISTMLSSQGAG